MKHLVASAGILVLLALGGCAGSSADPSPSSTTAVTASQDVEPVAEETAVPTPTPTPITREEASANYLALADAVNAVAGQINPLLDAGDVPSARTAATNSANALRTFADGLLAAEWPPEVQPAIDKLVAETAAEIPIWLQAAASTTDSDFWFEIDKLAPTGSAQEVRILLGLDNVPVG